jgi:hypothetical protein
VARLRRKRSGAARQGRACMAGAQARERWRGRRLRLAGGAAQAGWRQRIKRARGGAAGAWEPERRGAGASGDARRGRSGAAVAGASRCGARLGRRCSKDARQRQNGCGGRCWRELAAPGGAREQARARALQVRDLGGGEQPGASRGARSGPGARVEQRVRRWRAAATGGGAGAGRRGTRRSKQRAAAGAEVDAARACAGVALAAIVQGREPDLQAGADKGGHRKETVASLGHRHKWSTPDEG